MSLHLIDHPVVKHKFTLMRDKKTTHKDFCELLDEISMLMLYEVEIFVAALDDHLNDKGDIVPGLSDAGDRIFGTVR